MVLSVINPLPLSPLLQQAGGPSELAALAGPAFAAKQSAVLVGSSQPVAAARSSPFLKAQALQQVGQTPEIVYYVPVLQQPLTVTGQQVLAAAPAAEATGAAAAAAESEEAAAPAAESQEAPRVSEQRSIHAAAPLLVPLSR